MKRKNSQLKSASKTVNDSVRKEKIKQLCVSYECTRYFFDDGVDVAAMYANVSAETDEKRDEICLHFTKQDFRRISRRRFNFVCS